MANIYVRNIDAAIKEKLKESASVKGMSLNKYVVNLLESHGENITVRTSAEKYENLVKDVISIYQEKINELTLVINRNNYLMEKLLIRGEDK